MRQRFQNELGYKYTAAYPIFDKNWGNPVMYYMIHASDHDEAPALWGAPTQGCSRAAPANSATIRFRQPGCLIRKARDCNSYGNGSRVQRVHLQSRVRRTRACNRRIGKPRTDCRLDRAEASRRAPSWRRSDSVANRSRARPRFCPPYRIRYSWRGWWCYMRLSETGTLGQTDGTVR